MREIGGYLQLEKFTENPYHKEAIELNTGRNALLYLIKAKQIQKIYIPYYLCDSVSNMLKRYGITYEYYHIDTNFKPIISFELKDQELLYIVNYFGQISNKQIKEYKDKYSSIVIDNTQAFFQLPVAETDTLYSIRKYFGVPDGAYLYTNQTISESLTIDRSSERMRHLLGRYEGKASTYYNDFKENDDSFEGLSLLKMSKLTKNLLGAIDYEQAERIRNENYGVLSQGLSELNCLKLSKPNGPFMYPLYIENGMEIKKYLANKKIYIPTLWPNVLRKADHNSIEYQYATNIMPLPCDHRYGTKEMEYLIRAIKMKGE
ncbi:hypothetical protein MKX73_12550 [Solibacillus sp. FSL W7-1436]|uniref:hypothetical protein n=1 Tax=Solibacillus sp. FSL W7-1436 TaxID=2921705 RepID=UPI0030FA0D43